LKNITNYKKKTKKKNQPVLSQKMSLFFLENVSEIPLFFTRRELKVCINET
jgi:hypothetical protein